MSSKTYLTCVGTRPEIIKMAVLHRLLQSQGHRMVLLHTGQHEAMAHALYDFFQMPPDVTLDLRRKSASLSDLTVALMEGVDQVMTDVRPDAVLVQGDTTSALVGALVANYHDRPVAHIEAGLRTHEHDPFPEEKNRVLIGQLAHWHFPPTDRASANLHSEGVPAERVFQVGNTVIDATHWTRDRLLDGTHDASRYMPAPLKDFLNRFPHQPLILITAHRRENWGEPIRDIARATAALVERFPEAIAVWPVHPNPAVRADVEATLERVGTQARPRICVTEPLSYPALIALLMRCQFTLTDSGGIQEEASALGKPVLVARLSTERQELIEAGGAVLVGTQVENILKQATVLLTDATARERMRLATSPFGDGRSAERIAQVLATTS